MDSAEVVHRFHFAFTATFHYLFPQLTMGLALLLVFMETRALRSGDPVHAAAARFWAGIFALNFVFGVATGIPLEFEFGTNWAGFARAAGDVIGQTLAMEGVFAFFLESSLLGILLAGGKRLSPKGRWTVTFLLFLGTWLSGWFIVSTNAWMQHPVGHSVDPDGRIRLTSLGAVLTNPWAVWQWLHTIAGSVVTASFVVLAVGAFYLLVKRHEAQARGFVRLGVFAGLPATLLLAFPTGDAQAQYVLEHHPAAFAAMEGHFETKESAALVFVGQPDMERLVLDNPIEAPGALSFLSHHRFAAEVKGLKAFPRDEWPQNVPLLYYAYHVMVGLGTILIAVLLLAAWKLWRGTLWRSRGMLGVLALAFPFPYVANTAGWLTTELGRQPWVVFGLLRTKDAHSPDVSSGNALFTLIGFFGVYAVLAALYLFLMGKRIARGPGPDPAAAPDAAHAEGSA